MIEELKPCPEMVEKVAEIMYSQPWHRSVTPFAEIDARTQEHFRELARHTLAAITAYDPDKRLSQEVDELKHDLERQMTIANIECNEAERLRKALELAKAHLGAGFGDHPIEAIRQSNINAAWHAIDAALSHNGG